MNFLRRFYDKLVLSLILLLLVVLMILQVRKISEVKEETGKTGTSRFGIPDRQCTLARI